MHRKTIRHFNSARHAHFLTFSCFQRRDFLTKDRTRMWLVHAIEKARTKHQFHLWAYVLMPEHVHLVLWPTRRDYSIAAILQSIKQPVARLGANWVRDHAPASAHQMQHANTHRSDRLHFWQEGPGVDTNLFTPFFVWQKIDYIHLNPVRRGLVHIPSDWAWSSARAYTRHTHDGLSIDFESLPDTPASRGMNWT